MGRNVHVAQVGLQLRDSAVLVCYVDMYQSTSTIDLGAKAKRAAVRARYCFGSKFEK